MYKREVVRGLASTIAVTVGDIAYHTAAVASGLSRALLVSDLPFLADATPERALDASQQLAAAGAQMVKLEGAGHKLETIRFLTEREIPVCAHLGLTPQSVLRRGGYRVRGGEERAGRVHGGGGPFTDRSGDRLRGWMGVTEAEFYDLSRVAVVPMAFCFPGYDAKGADLAPPPICAATWRERVMAELGPVPLTLLVGGAAIRWHLGLRPGSEGVTAAVADWRGLSRHCIFIKESAGL